MVAVAAASEHEAAVRPEVGEGVVGARAAGQVGRFVAARADLPDVHLLLRPGEGGPDAADEPLTVRRPARPPDLLSLPLQHRASPAAVDAGDDEAVKALARRDGPVGSDRREIPADGDDAKRIAGEVTHVMVDEERPGRSAPEALAGDRPLPVGDDALAPRPHRGGTVGAGGVDAATPRSVESDGREDAVTAVGLDEDHLAVRSDRGGESGPVARRDRLQGLPVDADRIEAGVSVPLRVEDHAVAVRGPRRVAVPRRRARQPPRLRPVGAHDIDVSG